MEIAVYAGFTCAGIKHVLKHPSLLVEFNVKHFDCPCLSITAQQCKCACTFTGGGDGGGGGWGVGLVGVQEKLQGCVQR